MFGETADRVEERWNMRKLISDETGFQRFKYARYATDATFQKFCCLSGTTSDGKKHFSGNTSCMATG